MLRYVLFDMELFPNEQERAKSQKKVLLLLEVLTWCNQIYLREHPETPLIYKSGIKYIVPEQFEKAKLPEVDAVRTFLTKKGAPDSVMAAFNQIADQLGSGEHFREIPRIIENLGGDCDNVSCWRAAELRELGIPAKPFITWRKRADGGTTYHVTVLLGDGSTEDPSLLLGMGGADRAADREEEERKLGERVADLLSGDLSSTFGPQHGRTVVAGSVTTPQNFNQLQYSIPFQTDDAYEDWSPTRPQSFYFNPQYKSGLLPPGQSQGPIFNTLTRDPDDEWEDRQERFDGASPRLKALARKLHRHLKRAA